MYYADVVMFIWLLVLFASLEYTTRCLCDVNKVGCCSNYTSPDTGFPWDGENENNREEVRNIPPGKLLGISTFCFSQGKHRRLDLDVIECGIGFTQL